MKRLNVKEMLLVQDAVERENPNATERDFLSVFKSKTYDELVEMAINESIKQAEEV